MPQPDRNINPFQLMIRKKLQPLKNSGFSPPRRQGRQEKHWFLKEKPKAQKHQKHFFRGYILEISMPISMNGALWIGRSA
jgi:hypothetical protein